MISTDIIKKILNNYDKIMEIILPTLGKERKQEKQLLQEDKNVKDK